jgi:hypothetical protein
MTVGVIMAAQPMTREQARDRLLSVYELAKRSTACIRHGCVLWLHAVKLEDGRVGMIPSRVPERLRSRVLSAKANQRSIARHLWQAARSVRADFPFGSDAELSDLMNLAGAAVLELDAATAGSDDGRAEGLH